MVFSALLRHLLCTFLAVWYFQSCYEENWLPKGEYQKVKYFCLLCNDREVTLGRTLKWTFCGQQMCVVIASHCEHKSYALSAGPALLLFHFYISFSHLCNTFSCLAIMSLDSSIPPFLWSTVFSLYLSPRIIIIIIVIVAFIGTVQCLWKLWCNLISIVGE